MIHEPYLVTPGRFLKILASPLQAWTAWTNGKVILFRYNRLGEYQNYVGCRYEDCPEWSSITQALVALDSRFESVVWRC